MTATGFGSSVAASAVAATAWLAAGGGAVAGGGAEALAEAGGAAVATVGTGTAVPVRDGATCGQTIHPPARMTAPAANQKPRLLRRRWAWSCSVSVAPL